ncbi:MAG: hypothetical protein ACI4EW_00780 [Butyrivibrio sp.]
MKKFYLLILMIIPLMLTACGKNAASEETSAKQTSESDHSILDTLTEEQLNYLTESEQLSEDAIALMDYESVNWYFLGTGMELYNQSSGVEKNGIIYDCEEGTDYTNPESVNDKKITMEELYDIRCKEDKMRLEDFMEYEFLIKAIDADNNRYSMQVPVEEYQNTYAEINFKIKDDNTIYMRAPVLSYHVSDTESKTFSIYYDKATYTAFFENGDYSYDNKLYFGIQHSSVTGKSLVLQIFNNTEDEYSLNDSFEIYKITDGEKELLKDYSYTTEDVTQINKQTWSIHPVKFPSETKLDKGEYVIVFGSNDDDSVDVELEFNVE